MNIADRPKLLRIATYGIGLWLLMQLAGCATAPVPQTAYDKRTDFSAYHTFAFNDKLSMDEGRDYDSFATQYMKTALRQELTSRGYREAADAELLVNFYIDTQEKFSAEQAPLYSPAFYHYYFGYQTWPLYSQEVHIRQYTVGSLNIDLIDAKAKQLVWKGVLAQRVVSEPLEAQRSRLMQNVALIMQDFPPASAGNH